MQNSPVFAFEVESLKQNESVDQAVRTLVLLPDPLPKDTPLRSAPATRKSRAKRHLAWEQFDSDSGGLYGAYFLHLAALYPALTRMELMIASLVKGLLSNLEIAECLHICEETVQNHRSNIRRKLCLKPEQNLVKHLLTQN